MSDVKEYASRVKTLKVTDLKQEILTLKVGCTNITNDVNLTKSNDLDKDLDKALSSWYLTSGIMKTITSKQSGTKSMLEVISYGISTSEIVLDAITKDYVDKYGKTWDGSDINAKQVNVLNLLEHIKHFIEYSGTVMLVGIHIHDGDTLPEKYLTKASLNHLKETSGVYAETAILLLGGSKKLLTDLADTKELPVDDTDLEILESFGENKPKVALNKFGVHSLNPFYWVSSVLANVRLRRIENARRKNELYAMRIAQIVNRRNQTNDPSLDHRIEVYQNEIIKNEAYIAATEAKYA